MVFSEADSGEEESFACVTDTVQLAHSAAGEEAWVGSVHAETISLHFQDKGASASLIMGV